MSWHYLERMKDETLRKCVSSPSSRVLEEEFSGEFCSDGEPCAPLKSTPSVGRCCSDASWMDAYRASLSGTTSGHSTGSHGRILSTSSLAASHVKTSHARVPVKDLPVHVRAWYTKCSESLLRFGLRLSSPKTARTFVPMGSVKLSKHLAAWGMWDESGYWELGTSVQIINEIECGYLPTIRANKWGLPDSHGSTAAWEWYLPSCRASDADKGGRGDLLQAFRGNSNSHFRILPTPMASLGGSNRGGGGREGKDEKRRPSLESLLGGLWISFREWMMGWPIKWTALEPLETGRFQQWLDSHGAHLNNK